MRGPIVALFSLVILAAAVAGCGGGGGGAGAPVVPGRSMSGNTNVQVTLVVPQKTNAQGKRVPKFVSPSTQSAIVEILGPFPSTSPSPSSTIPPNFVVGEGFANFTPGSSACSTTSSGLSCTINIPAQITQAGTYAVFVITLDAAQTSNGCLPPIVTGSPAPSPTPTASGCAGNILGYNIAETTLTPGSLNPVNVTLGGFPVYLQPVELVSGLVGGQGNNGNGLTVFGPGISQVSFQLLDADKNIIAGNGALQLSVAQSATVTATISATPGPMGVYTLSLTPLTTNVGGQNVVTAGATQLFMTAIWPGANSLSNIEESINLPVIVRHSVMYVARHMGTPCNGLVVDEFLDGNTTPAVTDLCAGESQLGLAINPNDESLWVADYANRDIEVFPLALPGTTPSQSWTFCGIGSTSSCGQPGHSTSPTMDYPTFLAFDAGGNLFISNQTGIGSGYQVTAYSAAPGATPDPAGSTMWNFPGPYYYCHLAAGNNGSLYVGSAQPAILGLSTASGGPATMLNSANINGIAWAPDGTLWYLNEATMPALDSAARINPASPNTSLSTVSGIQNNPNQGIAVDSLGNLYFADGATTGIQEYTAASNWTTPTTLGNSVSPTYVAVFPDGVYGADHPVGVPQTQSSPVPIASPPTI